MVRGSEGQGAEKNSNAQDNQGRAEPFALKQSTKPNQQAQGGQQAPCENNSDLQCEVGIAPRAEKSDDAAWWGVGVSGVSALFSFISIILIFCALRQTDKSIRLAIKDRATATRRALQQSEETAEALRHAETSAAAMAQLAAVTVENARQIKESVDQQKAFGRMQMRPFLSVLIGDAEWQDSHHNFAAYPILQNTGHTPARNIRFQVEAAILPTAIPVNFKFWLPSKPSGSNTIGPGQTGTMAGIVKWRVPDDWVQRVKWGNEFALYVWGVVGYDDVFGVRHRTTFAQQIYWRQVGHPTESGVIPEVVRGVHLGRHNRAN